MTGGFGSGVLELIEEARLADPAYRETSGAHPRASPASGSSTTAPSPTCGASSASTQPGLAGQVREALDTLRAAPGRSEVAAG